MDEVRRVLEAARMTMNDLVMVTIFAPDVGDFAAFNAVYLSYFGDALPAAARRAAARLRFRHIRLVFLRLGIPRHSRNATIYVPDPRLAVSRLCEPKNRSPAMAPEGETGLVVEVPCSTGDALYELDGDLLAARVVAELGGIGLLDPRTVLGSESRMLLNAYPVYSLDYAEHVDLRSAGSFQTCSEVVR